MSVHLPRKKIKIKTDEAAAAKIDANNEAKPNDNLKSGDAAVVYKDKNHRIKKELSFSKSKGSKGLT